MNNLSPLGLITCFVFSMLLNGASFNAPSGDLQQGAYIVNHSSYTVYFKPESRKANPGLEPDAAYAVLPGHSFYGPIDAVVTPVTPAGKVFRVPTGARVTIDKKGIPHPANLVCRAGMLLPVYGDVPPPYMNFAKLANSKQVLYRSPDISLTMK